jgi:glycerophosphoryl diester phosphodiesterase
MNNIIFDCKSLIIGHRGSIGDVMENTLESLFYAIDSGVDGIEFDVQRCLTGELILFHDETLDRLAFKDQFYFSRTRKKKIQQLQWYDIYNTELIDSMGRKYKIPKLIDILRHPKVYMSDTLINIEIKDNQTHETLINMISELIDEGLYEPGRFLISSFCIDPLIYIQEFKSDMELKDSQFQNFKIGWIFSQDNIPAAGLLNSINFNSKVLTHIVLDKDITNNNNISFIKNLGLSIFVYTINHKEDFPIPDLCNKVEGIITDKPIYFR